MLIFDLDYLVFDCSFLKVQALRQSLIALADLIPQSIRLPEISDAEAGFRDYGFQWIQQMDPGLDEQSLDQLPGAYAIHEIRLIESGTGRLYPGMREFIMNLRREDFCVALGAESSRDYMISVMDRHPLDDLFQISLCTEEYGMGGAEEMMLEIMRQGEANPSETLVLGTRPDTFQSARAVNVLSVGCGWGIRDHSGLSGADFQAHSLSNLSDRIAQADTLALRHLD
ncbi:MAG: HAD hydrolase-like protein [Acidobacteria bacterium]|nr:HAD hydrolase-like protein [Acidobacteriota bacterium]